MVIDRGVRGEVRLLAVELVKRRRSDLVRVFTMPPLSPLAPKSCKIAAEVLLDIALDLCRMWWVVFNEVMTCGEGESARHQFAAVFTPNS